MEWFAFSSKFYLDLDDQGVSERAQMLLMRICAYIADNETSGYISEAATKKLGLTALSRRIDELLHERLIITSATKPGYEVPAWFKWNEALERLVRKRKADRERIAKKRSEPENVARQSHEKNAMSHDHIDSNNKKELSTQVERHTHLSNARDEMPRGPAVNVESWKLVRAAIPDAHPQAVRTDLAMRTNALLVGGTPPETITAALQLWLTKPNLGPATLPSLVSEIVKTANPVAPTGRVLSTADQRVAQAQALRARFENTPTPRELP